MELSRDGRGWRVGTSAEVAWIGGRPLGITIATALPLVFDAYATFHAAEDVPGPAHEAAVVSGLVRHTADQGWWLGFLDTGAHDVVFPEAPRVGAYFGWRYVLVLAGPEQALTWRTGHMRDGDGALPDLFFPEDRSWLVTALWDDTWTCIGGPDAVVDALVADPSANARRVRPDEDALPPGLERD